MLLENWHLCVSLRNSLSFNRSIMQFKITFELQQQGQLLPLSYQYELSSWIYRLISSADTSFGEFLHSKGYISGNKRFKLFTFSNLYVPPKFEILGDRMKIHSTSISFVVSFLVEQAARDLILGVFQNQSLRLGDKISQVDLKVIQVYNLPPVQIDHTTACLRTTSPLLVSEPEIRPNGRLWHNYLDPLQEKYGFYFFKNLKEKYQTALAHQLIEPGIEDTEWQFKMLSSKPRKRLIKIKAFTPAETKVVGYNFDFKLTAPASIIRLGILAGFGGENALGFGATRLLE